MALLTILDLNCHQPFDFQRPGEARSAAGSDTNISLAEWNETGTIGHLSRGHMAQGA